MLKNYFKIALRNIARNKLYSFINIFGLAVGITACVLIFLYVKDELSYDKHHAEHEKLFRVTTYVTIPGQNEHAAVTAMPVGPMLKSEFRQVEEFLRLDAIPNQTVWIGNEMFTEKKVAFADSSLFRIFSFPLSYGDPETALKEPLSAVISEEKARSWFGDPANALGKMLKFSRQSYMVTGVLKKTYEPTHIDFDIYLSMTSRPSDVINSQDFGSLEVYTYVKMNSGFTPQQFDNTIMPIFYEKHIRPWSNQAGFSGSFVNKLQPIEEVHFSSGMIAERSNTGNRSYVYIFSFLAVFILIIACINYMNLATARSVKRSKEVGLRKVVGATRRQLVMQFIGESVLISFLAILLAVMLVEILLPVFNGLTGKDFTFTNIFTGGFVLLLIGIVIFVGIFAGSYPAFYLSRFQPAEVLKGGGFNLGRTGKPGFIKLLFNPVNLRKILVVAQFAISVVLIVCTISIFSQLNFMKNKDLGFDKDQVMVIQVPGDSVVSGNLQAIKSELSGLSFVRSVSISSGVPGNVGSRLLFNVDIDGVKNEKVMNMMMVDEDFLKTLGISLIKGRNFSRDFKTDSAAFIVNEAAAEYIGFPNPINKKMNTGFNGDGTIIGEVRNFNYASLHNGIDPLVLMLVNGNDRFVSVKIKGGDIREAVSSIEKKWKSYDRNHPMEYYFLDENLNTRYQSEEKMLSVFGYFAGLTILISCLGLFGLASFATEQRTKEIGIRKVLGASVGNIVTMINKDFIILILISFLFAFPLAWYFMDKWLQDFHYRVNIGWLPFAAAALAALLVSVTTISLQAFKAAYSNPVKALKYE